MKETVTTQTQKKEKAAENTGPRFLPRTDIYETEKEFALKLDMPGVAEKDLEIRGPGEFLGRRQSGLPELRLASLMDVKMLEIARQEAELLFKDDPLLERPEHLALREQVAQFWQQVSDIS